MYKTVYTFNAGINPRSEFFDDMDLRIWGLYDGSAQFVDVIHTSVNIWSSAAKRGHVDFYPNLGDAQPACELGLYKYH